MSANIGPFSVLPDPRVRRLLAQLHGEADRQERWLLLVNVARRTR